MKRYRILTFDFDSRAHNFEPIQDHWEDKIKEQHTANREKTIQELIAQHGKWNHGQKIHNFIDLKRKPFSIAAFHNKFLEQIRNAYIVGSYYPALTGACALGERILNHMMILLRDYHKDAPEYKKVYRKDSFDQWPVAIDALESWDELLPEAAERFRNLNGKRNSAIHFNPETDTNDQVLALESIHLMQEIVEIQFAAFGKQPWYFCVPGEMYIRKEWEQKPLIKHIFIPNAVLVGYKHKIESVVPEFVISDHEDYEDREVSDEEFIELRKNR